MTIPGNWPRTQGHNFNFYNEIAVSNGTLNTNPDLFITFKPAYLSFFVKGTGSAIVGYSFNGISTDGYIYQTAAAGYTGRNFLEFYGRVVSGIYFFALSGGPATIAVEAYSVE